MKAMVTGGAGFIGSHLTEHLLDQGHEVVVFDDFTTGRRRNLDRVRGNERLTLVNGSVRDRSRVEKVMAGVDSVFHLAAALGQFTLRDRLIESLRTNLDGPMNVLEAAVERDVRVLLVSTSEIYGDNPKIGLAEDDARILGSPLTPRWSYSEAKALQETLTAHYVHTAGLRAVIVRPFNVVGPRQSGQYGMVIPRFVRQALAGEELTVFGTGRQIRCFCHVADVVPAMAKLLATEEAYGQAVNLGGDQQVEIGALAQLAIDVTGSTSKVVYLPHDDVLYKGYEDVQRRVPDCGRARELIGFTPTRSLETIIKDVAEHARAESGEPPEVRPNGLRAVRI